MSGNVTRLANVNSTVMLFRLLWKLAWISSAPIGVKLPNEMCVVCPFPRCNVVQLQQRSLPRELDAVVVDSRHHSAQVFDSVRHRECRRVGEELVHAIEERRHVSGIEAAARLG